MHCLLLLSFVAVAFSVTPQVCTPSGPKGAWTTQIASHASQFNNVKLVTTGPAATAPTEACDKKVYQIPRAAPYFTFFQPIATTTPSTFRITAFRYETTGRTSDWYGVSSTLNFGAHGNNPDLLGYYSGNMNSAYSSVGGSRTWRSLGVPVEANKWVRFDIVWDGNFDETRFYINKQYVQTDSVTRYSNPLVYQVRIHDKGTIWAGLEYNPDITGFTRSLLQRMPLCLPPNRQKSYEWKLTQPAQYPVFTKTVQITSGQFLPPPAPACDTGVWFAPAPAGKDYLTGYQEVSPLPAKFRFTVWRWDSGQKSSDWIGVSKKRGAGVQTHPHDVAVGYTQSGTYGWYGPGPGGRVTWYGPTKAKLIANKWRRWDITWDGTTATMWVDKMALASVAMTFTDPLVLAYRVHGVGNGGSVSGPGGVGSYFTGFELNLNPNLISPNIPLCMPNKQLRYDWQLIDTLHLVEWTKYTQVNAAPQGPTGPTGACDKRVWSTPPPTSGNTNYVTPFMEVSPVPKQFRYTAWRYDKAGVKTSDWIGVAEANMKTSPHTVAIGYTQTGNYGWYSVATSWKPSNIPIKDGWRRFDITWDGSSVGFYVDTGLIATWKKASWSTPILLSWRIHQGPGSVWSGFEFSNDLGFIDSPVPMCVPPNRFKRYDWTFEIAGQEALWSQTKQITNNPYAPGPNEACDNRVWLIPVPAGSSNGYVTPAIKYVPLPKQFTATVFRYDVANQRTSDWLGVSSQGSTTRGDVAVGYIQNGMKWAVFNRQQAASWPATAVTANPGWNRLDIVYDGTTAHLFVNKQRLAFYKMSFAGFIQVEYRVHDATHGGSPAGSYVSGFELTDSIPLWMSQGAKMPICIPPGQKTVYDFTINQPQYKTIWSEVTRVTPTTMAPVEACDRRAWNVPIKTVNAAEFIDFYYEIPQSMNIFRITAYRWDEPGAQRPDWFGLVTSGKPPLHVKGAVGGLFALGHGNPGGGGKITMHLPNVPTWAQTAVAEKTTPAWTRFDIIFDGTNMLMYVDTQLVKSQPASAVQMTKPYYYNFRVHGSSWAGKGSTWAGLEISSDLGQTKPNLPICVPPNQDQKFDWNLEVPGQTWSRVTKDSSITATKESCYTDVYKIAPPPPGGSGNAKYFTAYHEFSPVPNQFRIRVFRYDTAITNSALIIQDWFGLGQPGKALPDIAVGYIQGNNYRTVQIGKTGWLDTKIPSKTGWVEFSVTYDGTTARAYIDDVLVNTKAMTLNGGLSVAFRAHDLNLGTGQGAGPNPGFRWTGFEIDSSALSAFPPLCYNSQNLDKWIIKDGSPTSASITTNIVAPTGACNPAVGAISHSVKGTFQNFIPTQAKLYFFNAYFYDTSADDDRNDWIGGSLKTIAEWAVGVYSNRQFYSYYDGAKWTATTVARTVGWHTFEAVASQSSVVLKIDGGVIVTLPKQIPISKVTVRGNIGNGRGIWAGMQLCAGSPKLLATCSQHHSLVGNMIPLCYQPGGGAALQMLNQWTLRSGTWLAIDAGQPVTGPAGACNTIVGIVDHTMGAIVYTELPKSNLNGFGFVAYYYDDVGQGGDSRVDWIRVKGSNWMASMGVDANNPASYIVTMQGVGISQQGQPYIIRKTNTRRVGWVKFEIGFDGNNLTPYIDDNALQPFPISSLPPVDNVEVGSEAGTKKAMWSGLKFCRGVSRCGTPVKPVLDTYRCRCQALKANTMTRYGPRCDTLQASTLIGSFESHKGWYPDHEFGKGGWKFQGSDILSNDGKWVCKKI